MVRFAATVRHFDLCQTSEPSYNKTLHVSDSSSVHHQESSTVHTAICICHTGFVEFLHPDGGLASSVGIATELRGWAVRGSHPSGGRDFPHLSRPDLGPTQPPVQWVHSLSRGKERPERDADHSPLLVPWSRKSRVIPLLPLWAVRPVQSLSACTRVHFTFYRTHKFVCIYVCVCIYIYIYIYIYTNTHTHTVSGTNAIFEC